MEFFIGQLFELIGGIACNVARIYIFVNCGFNFKIVTLKSFSIFKPREQCEWEILIFSQTRKIASSYQP